MRARQILPLDIAPNAELRHYARSSGKVLKMLNTIDDYLDHVAKLHGFSDRDIGRALNMRSNSISHWRTRRAWPSENHMIALCKLGDLDTARGLVMLAQWRSEGEATDVWRNLLSALLVLVALLLMPGSSAQAASGYELRAAPTVYYGKWRRFLRSLIARPCHA
jgi:hypothetical protein